MASADVSPRNMENLLTNKKQKSALKLQKKAAKDIPLTKQFDKLAISRTPGGTIYGTTPGGTRIEYSLKDMLSIAETPASNSPPPNLSDIPLTLIQETKGGIAFPQQGVPIRQPASRTTSYSSQHAYSSLSRSPGGLLATSPQAHHPISSSLHSNHPRRVNRELPQNWRDHENDFEAVAVAARREAALAHRQQLMENGHRRRRTVSENHVHEVHGKGNRVLHLNKVRSPPQLLKKVVEAKKNAKNNNNNNRNKHNIDRVLSKSPSTDEHDVQFEMEL